MCDDPMQDEMQDQAGGQHEVSRSVDVEAPPEVVWDVLADPEARRLWLDDDDASDRVLRIDGEDPGRSLTWTWWHPGDTPAFGFGSAVPNQTASRVDIVLTELASGGTRVAVTERLVARPGGATLSAQAVTGRSGRAWAGATVSAWSQRLVGLELLLLTAGVCVA